MERLSSSFLSTPMGKVLLGVMIAAGIMYAAKEGFAFGQWLRIH